MSRVTLDLYKCTNYTGQLHQMNRRIQELDKALYDLYDEIGWGNHKYLRRADGIVSYSGKLQRCGNYLSDTASSFQKLQDELYLSDISELAQYKGKSSWKISDTVNAGIGTVGSLLNKMGELLTTSITGPTVGDVWAQIGYKYVDIFKELAGDKVKGFKDTFEKFDNYPDRAVAWYKWFNKEIWSPIKTGDGWIKNITEENIYKAEGLIPEGVSDFFDKLADCANVIEGAKAIKEYSETGDFQNSFDDFAFTLFGEGFKEWNKWKNEADNLKYLGVDKQVSNVLVDTIVKMPEKWYKGIKEYAENGTGTAGSIVVDSTVGAFTESVAGAAKPVYVAATAVTYPVIDQVCESFGYDLSGEYERLTGETGLKAVFKAQKELWVDVVYEGAKDKAADFVDGFYDTVKDGWDSWKSGMKLIFG